MIRKLNKFFSILLVVCMLLSMVPAAVFAATPSVIYLKPSSDWLSDSARFSAYYYNAGGDATWVSMSDSDGDGYYEATVPSGYTYVIFCRMNPSSSTNSWDYKWNQTSDLTIPTDGDNCWVLYSGDWNGGGYWDYYTTEVDYYLFGYINGANYACEENSSSLGSYKFVDGSLTVTFTSDSYVGVKTGDNSTWYMAQSYTTSTSATLYKTSTGAGEKMFVPGGIQVTFTLTKSGETLKLSYTVKSSTCQHLSHTTAGKCTACGSSVSHTWSSGTCSGCGTTCSHSSHTTAGKCSTCSMTVSHTWSSSTGKCTVCSKSCSHSWSSGKCSTCGMSCAHSSHSTAGKCSTCSMTVSHSWSGSSCSVCGKTCSHSWSSGKCSTCGSTCTHTSHSTAGKCSTCSMTVSHTWSSSTGKCTVCSKSCSHSWSSGKCSTCGMSCAHSSHSTAGKCSTCSMTVSHTWSSSTGKCTVCSKSCSHTSHTTAGKCSTCGYAVGHSWSNGTCSGCGTSCSHSFSGDTCTLCGTTRSFYLFGYINGANYGCDEDASTLGSYKFTNNSLTVTFTSDSYVAVKTGDNASWYMTNGYLGNVTSATLYNTNSGITADKLYVPGGVKLTFTLTVNSSSDTLTLSYSIDSSTCSHTNHTTAGKCTVCGSSVSHSYSGGICSVCGTTCSHSWSGGKCSTCGVSCTHSYSGATCTLCGTTRSYYLFGYINGANYACEEDSDNLGSYKFTNNKLTVTFTEDSYVGVKTSDNATWYMTNGYLGNVTSATLYNTNSGITADKLYVPGGTKITFTLTINTSSDTVKLSYSVDSSSCEHLNHNTSGKCTACGSAVSHEWANGACSVCGASCSHSWSNGKCSTCGMSCTHSWSNGTCSVCGSTCSHSYSGSTCTVCGSTRSYYLFGYINGANYACQEDSDNLGSYQFSSGKLTVTFTEDSYVGVKTSDNASWYMTDGYLGNVTSATLYNTTSGINADKLFVPGGVKVTFTLTVNASKDTLTLSYSITSSTCQHLNHTTAGKCSVCGSTVSHSYSDGVCTVCGGECSHSWSSGKCSTCGASCTHSWSGSTCTVCGASCSHSWSNGKCSTCGSTCTHAKHTTAGKCSTCGSTVSHSYSNGSCSVCGKACTHSYSGGKCTICGAACTHSYSGGKCTVCGESCTHSYSGATCTVCGSTRGYYLFGYINGANYACEEDDANLGIYKFSNNKLTVTFTEDSYVGVKTSDHSAWYMTDGYLGEVTSATLYNTNTGAGEKLYVPGGVQVTFSLTVNASSDTLTLSYSVNSSSCEHLTHGSDGCCTTCGSVVGHSWSDGKCTACGTSCGHSWSNGKCAVCGTSCGHSWSSGKCGVCGTACSHSYSGSTCTVCGNTRSYYLFGYINGANYACDEDSDNLGTYQFSSGKLTVTFTEDSYVGVKTSDNATWYMTDGYQGNATTATLYNTTSGINADKLYVPGGVKVTFTLTINSAKDTLTLSYTTDNSTCQHLTHGTDGVCTSCGCVVSHSFTGGVCGVCGLSCTHADHTTAGACIQCGSSVSHTYSDGSCSVCGKACSHSFSGSTCTVCGAACSHSWSGSTCSACGSTRDYYLFGYINSANYGCEEDADNLGIYKFSGGKLTVTFSQDSYIGVKTGDDNWYMTQFYVTDSTATLYNTTSGTATEKMFVPGGVKVTFTLTASSSKDTLTLSYTTETITCQHLSHDVNGICTGCGSIVSHSYVSGVCSGCGLSCSHTGHSTAGVCTVCGLSVNHSYAEGYCTVCGGVDPNYSSTVDYYLFGWINGGDYACQSDYENLGDYKFENGSLTVIFQQASYVGVKTGDNANWYMTEGYLGNTTTATLYNTNKLYLPEKLYVPGGVEVTFTLTVNSAKDTLTLKYVTAACSHSSHNTSGVCTGCGATVEHTYSGGVCTVCGVAEPEQEYYLFGYINGADYGWNDDAANIGIYKFVNGSLTVTFTEDSYVAVKTGDNAHWYMANGWVGEASSVTLRDMDPYSASANRLYVPGNKQLTFTLSKNWDDSLTLSYTVAASDCEHVSHNASGICTNCGETVEHTYVSGVCTVCNASDPDYQEVTYYLFGYINGANYACEEDSDNIGSFIIRHGGASFTFTQDSYVGVKTGDNSNWYMAQSYTTANSVVLYNTSTGAGEKLYVPGGVKVNFTLVENSDGTLTLSYTTEAAEICTHPGHDTNGYCTTCHEVVEHTYSGGVCTVCGVAEPTQTDYYLFGYINGEDYACEGDYATIGIYRFVDGKLTVTFTQDSYVAVKTGDNAVWYMTQGYLGNVTTATLYSTETGANEKLYVPGNLPITFTLTENSDGTLTLSYVADASSCTHPGHDTSGVCGTCGSTVSHSYENGACTVCGAACSHSWSNSVCTVCGASCGHIWSGNTCTQCGKTCSHSWSDGYCSKCDSECTHNWSGSTCAVCGKSAAVTSGVKLHFVNTLGWDGVVGYAWVGDTALTGYQWPGVTVNRDVDGYYTLELDYEPTAGESLNVLFHNFNGSQTADVALSFATLNASREVWIKPNTYTNSSGKYDCTTATSEGGMVISPEVNGTSVTFRYEGSASKVYLSGSFNNWSTTATPMTKGSDGVWSTTLSLVPGAYEYKFIVDGSWICDPTNGVVGGYDSNSMLIVPADSTIPNDGKITVKLHFYRSSGDYTDWDVWFWCAESSGSAELLEVDGDKGLVATYTLDGSNKNLGYTVRKTDWSDKEFYDRYIDLSDVSSGTVHFYLNSGSATGSRVLGEDVISAAKLSYANYDYETGKVWVKSTLPLTGDWANAFTIVDASGNATDITVKSAVLDGNGYALTLSRTLALSESNAYQVLWNGSYATIAVDTHSLFYTDKFAEDYGYYGNDLGATWSSSYTTFKVWAPTALAVHVKLYDSGNYGSGNLLQYVEMKQGDKGVWYVTVSGDLHGYYYNYDVSFATYTVEATDPYAVSVGANGDRGMILNLDATDPEGWDNDISPNKYMSYTDAIIYEMHVREMTIDSSSGVDEELKGTYLGLTQSGTNYNGYSTALEHLKELGVTHVQLMPVYDFASLDEYNLDIWEQYGWGYDPKNMNAPDGSYSTDPFDGSVRVTEFKQMVQTFHSNGINVVMDVVYNHTFSGGDFCYNKIVPNYFSRFYGEGNWSNGSGCGNDFATERVMARNFIVDSVLYWVEEYHIDGFRFDLAGLIDTQTINEIVSTVHAKYPYVMFYGEGWGGGTAVEEGYTLTTKDNAWATSGFGFFNDNYRNAIAGDNGSSWGFASGSGSYADAIGSYFRASNGWSTSPTQTINYVACHDNYCLTDKLLISRNGAYWEEIARMNGLSAAMVMLAQGIPFIYSGDEMLREKKDASGTRYDNAFGTDDYVNKIRWSDLQDKDYAQVLDDYYGGLIEFRKNHAALRCANGSDAWNYTTYYKINDNTVMFYVSGYPNYECSDGIVIIFNGSGSAQSVNLGNYGIPSGYWQACIHGLQAGVTPLWGVDVGSGYGTVSVEGYSATVLVLGDLIHEDSIYNQNLSLVDCSHVYHTAGGLCTVCGKSVSHSFSAGYCTVCGLSQSTPDTVTVYYDNSTTGWSNVYVYAWAEAAGRVTEYGESWPGSAMTSIGSGIYSFELPTAATNVIFTDGGGNQTGDLTPPAYDSVFVRYDPATGSWVNYVEGCDHADHNTCGMCTACGEDTEHTYSYGVCTVCGLPEDPPATQVIYYDNGLTDWTNVYVYAWAETVGRAVEITDAWPGVQMTLTNETIYSATIPFGANKVIFHNGAGEQTANLDLPAYGAEEDTYSSVMYGWYRFLDVHTCEYDIVVTEPTCDAEGYSTYTCIHCGSSFVTEYTDSTTHEFTDSRCADCGTVAGHEHSYTTKVVAATCTGNGYTVYHCPGCSYSYIDNETLAVPHSYSNGKCSVCGVADAQQYYLFGYINGANYGYEGDYATMGSYSFTDGKLTVSFEQDSYIGIKAAGNAHWYMTQTYQTGKSATFYNTTTGAMEKMLVPGGIMLTFTLTENSNGTLTLSYTTTDDCDHEYSWETVSEMTCTAPGVTVCSCSLCGFSSPDLIYTCGHTYADGICTVCGERQTTVDSTLADYVQDGCTLQCWNWSIANIEANMGLIASLGYTSIQLSPIQTTKEATKNKPYDNWWVLYQPVDFEINEASGHCVGTREEFISLCETAHKYNIKVIVDVVSNHLANNGANTLSPLIPDDIRLDSSCWHDYTTNSWDYSSRYNITQYCMAGLPDLNTGSDKIQNYVLDYLKDLIDCGADGFRFDAAKQIETPSDNSSFASDFWPTVVNGASSYASTTRGIYLYCYGELLQNPDESGELHISAYTPYMSVTESVWSNDVRNYIYNGNAGSIQFSYFKDCNADKLVLWAESHDTFGDGSSDYIPQDVLNRAWAIVASRAYTMALYFPRASSLLTQEMGQIAKTGWSSVEVAAVNRFHNQFIGTSEYCATYGSYAYVERGGAGVVIVSSSASSGWVSVPNHTLAAGTYTDQITGNTFTVSSDGWIYGDMGSTGIAVVCNAIELDCEHPDHGTDGYCYDCYAYVGHSGNTTCTDCGAATTRTIYFTNTDGWSKVYLYGWHDNGDVITSAWPGNAMTLVEGNTYKITVPTSVTNIIFNNGSGSQTANLVPAADGDTYDYASGFWSTYGQIDMADHYYLYGSINGTDYNGTDYTFVDGSLTLVVNSDSYVFVGDSNGGEYMTDSWLGEVTSAVMYRTGILTYPNKLFLPAGNRITLTLTVASNDSVVLSYSIYECEHTEHDADGVCLECGVSVSHTYVAGNCYVCSRGITVTNGVTIHLVNTLGWNGAVAYAWVGETALEGFDWPGVTVNRDSNGYFTLNLDYEPTSGEDLGLTFHNWNGAQTSDLTIPFSTLNTYRELWIKPNTYTNSSGKYDCTVVTAESGTVISPEVNYIEVIFRYEDASAKSVSVAGNFNDWSETANPMTLEDGVWSTSMTLMPGAYEYKFVVDGQWILDPLNGTVGGYDGNSMVITPEDELVEDTGKITVKLHFYRSSGDYTDWDVWFWCNESSGAAELLEVDGDKGLVATYTLDGTNTSLGYTVRKTDWSDKEFYDRYIDLSDISSGTVHFYLNSGSATGSRVLGEDVISAAKLSYATYNYDTGKVWVKSTMPFTGDWANGFSIVDASGNATDITVKSAVLDGNGYTLTLSRELTLSETNAYQVKWGGYYATITINTHDLFYTSKFAEQYSYYGDDLGATWSKNYTTFKVWAPTAMAVHVKLYDSGNYGSGNLLQYVEMKQGSNGVWYVTVSGNLHGYYYNYDVSFGSYTVEATDPYAVSVGANGDRGMILNMDATDPEGWDSDISPNKNMSYTDAIIYEMHVREMTIDSTSGVDEELRGTYLGLTQTGTNYNGYSTALEHLKELGVTHVQLMPVYDFASLDEYNLDIWEQYGWGYDPKNYNSPDGSYSTDPFDGSVRVTEFKQMVQTFHSNGINVIMDVVYNHTFSGGDFCYNKIVPNYFSRFYGEGNWSNGSGCGNDFATERVMARNFIVDSIMHWVEEYHIDGFRFDLAGLIDTQTINEIVNTVHAKYPYVMFYGEGWAAGDTAVEYGNSLASQGNAWEVSGFGFFNDSFRNAIAGDNGNSWGFATGNGGYADAIANYFRASNGWSTSPTQTINYVACHDNYCLTDKIILSRDGAYWEEMVRMNGLSAAMVMLAQGVPLIYSGDEMLREKKDASGTRYDNAFGTDDYVNKIRWNELQEKDYAQVLDDYYGGLIDFRKNHSALRVTNGSDAWNYTTYYKINDNTVMFYVSGYPNYECSDGIVIIFNGSGSTQYVNLGNYGIPSGYWQACIHGLQAGVTPLWGVDVGSGYGEVGVEAYSATVLVLGDLIHEDSVYNQNLSLVNCSHVYHYTSGLCSTCGATASHYYSNGYCTTCGLSQSAPDTVTIYYDNTTTGWTNVKVYAWAEAAGRTTEYTGSWPGNSMTDMGNGIYSFEMPIEATNAIFTDGEGNQTGNLVLPHYSSVFVRYDPSVGDWDNYVEGCAHESHIIAGLCSTCGEEVSHSYSGGYCTVCQRPENAPATQVIYYDNGSTDWEKVYVYAWAEAVGCVELVTDAWPGQEMTLTNETIYSATIPYGANLVIFHNGEGAQTSNLSMPAYSSGLDTYSSVMYSWVSYMDVHTCDYDIVVTEATCDVEGYTTYTCKICGFSFQTEYTETTDHTYVNERCEDCGGEQVHLHNYQQTVVAATCTSDGYTLYHCPECGHSYIDDAVLATCHTYSGGKCTACGVADAQQYYLFGYINGADYGCQDDYATMGSYSFTDGKLTCSFEQDSYIAIKSGDNSRWYMTHTYVDGTSATFYNTSSNSYEKMFVPGGVKITFTLVVNDNDTLSLSYITTETCEHEYNWEIVSEATCTVPSVMVCSCDLCGFSSADVMYANGHSYESVTVAPTCTGDGYTRHTCTVCGDSYTDGATTATGHIYNSSITTAATCGKDGVRTYTCVTCGDSYTETIPGTGGHGYSSEITTAATCTTAGVRTYTCGKCGDSFTEVIPATGHSYSATVTKPTCTAEGYTTYTCTKCGDSYTGSNVSATGHSYSSVVTAPTCTAEGYTTYTCSKCGDTYTWNVTAATGHSYENGKCTVCGSSDPNTYYLFGYINGANYACEEDYENMGKYLFVDGKLTVTFDTESYVAVKSAGNAKWYMAMSYTTASRATLYDTALGGCEKLTVPGGVEVTFTLTENSDGTLTLSYTTEGALCIHSYAYRVTTAATCTTTGVKTYTCTKCGDSYSEITPATGHSYTVTVVAPTCTTGGYTSHVCAGCGDSYTDSQTAATGHSYLLTVTAPTCTTGGYTTYKCSRCGNSYTSNSVSATGHSYTAVVTAPTCTESGYTTYTCAKCGDSYTWNLTAPVGHSFRNGSCTVCGESDPNAGAVDYYLFGFIDGANYGCEEDYETIGRYLFVNGSLTVYFDFDSYVAVKTGDNVNWYMALEYTTDTSVVLYSTEEGGCEKLFVPGGVEVTFTLTENADGTVTLSYETQEDAACSHSYTARVTKAPGCTTEGTTTYTCSKCGDSYTTAIAATGHNYSGSSCTVCGETDPDYVPSTDYYLFGYINGADYACESDYENLGEYKFVDGKLTVKFTENSYVAVKSGDNVNWFMATAYTTTNTVNLYNTKTGAQEKLLVPGGVEVTFTLTVNADGSLTLSYEKNLSTVPNLKLSYASLSFEDEIRYNLYFTASDLDDVVELGLLVFNTQNTNGTYATASQVISQYSYNGTNYMCQTEGVAAKKMGDSLYFKVYAKLADGTYAYSAMVSYNAVSYAKSILNKSTNDYMKKLVVALMNYGAEAQKFFNYNTDNLMNSFLTEEQQAMVGAYSTDTMPNPVSVDSSKNGMLTNTGFGVCYITVSFDGAFSMNYYFNTSNTPDGDVTMYYWTEEAYAAADTLSPENASGSMTMTLTGTANQYWACIDGIAAKEMGDTIFVGGIYTCNGVTYATKTINYSLGKYCDTIASNNSSAQQALAMATAVYGAQAREYFANK